MIQDYAPARTGQRQAVLAIAVGGLVAGTVDLLQACFMFGWTIPLSIAAGVLGGRAGKGGVEIYILGVFLHFFIATSAATIYYAARRRLAFLAEHWVICGLFYGIAVELFMRLVVLPLSALHATGPFKLRGLIQGLLVHMVTVGLPISYSIRRFTGK